MIDKSSILWQYLSPEQRVLLGDGDFLVADSLRHRDTDPTDYSYLVFPYAKMYEGFLKQLFRDSGIISDHEYRSSHFRIGKALSPNLAHRLGPHSAYGLVEKRYGPILADRLWHTWKEARNLVFHYFPHNYRALSREQAVHLVNQILETMQMAVEETHVRLGVHKV